MKSIKKILFVMVALAATLAFVSCSNGDDDPSTVAVYKGSYMGVTVTATFLDDNTWTMTGSYEGETKTMASGTYTGDPSKDGEVTIKVTKAVDEDGKLVDVSEYDIEEKLTVTDGKLTYDGITFTRQ